jgi:RimJ/RimL family protein N-acetyltransferase
MEKSISFRDLREEDVDFVYMCKNDEKLNRYVVGDWHPFSHEEAEAWLRGCMTNSADFKYWAVCSNDSEERIVGWVSLSKINPVEKSAHFYGIVIGDKQYQGGTAWMECYQMIFEKVFLEMKYRRLTGSHLSIHPVSGLIEECMFMDVDKVERNAIEKNGELVDHIFVSIDSESYLKHYRDGDYELPKIESRILSKYREIYRARKKK